MKSHINIVIKSLRDHLDEINTLKQWFYQEWSDHYQSESMAEVDLRHYVETQNSVPFAVIAYYGQELCGAMVIKEEPFLHYPYSPWIGGAYVKPNKRGLGIGDAMVHYLENYAQSHHIYNLYTATASAKNLFLCRDWEIIEQTNDGHYILNKNYWVTTIMNLNVTKAYSLQRQLFLEILH